MTEIANRAKSIFEHLAQKTKYQIAAATDGIKALLANRHGLVLIAAIVICSICIGRLL